jgi:hypothetical protein
MSVFGWVYCGGTSMPLLLSGHNSTSNRLAIDCTNTDASLVARYCTVLSNAKYLFGSSTSERVNANKILRICNRTNDSWCSAASCNSRATNALCALINVALTMCWLDGCDTILCNDSSERANDARSANLRMPPKLRMVRSLQSRFDTFDELATNLVRRATLSAHKPASIIGVGVFCHHTYQALITSMADGNHCASRSRSMYNEKHRFSHSTRRHNSDLCGRLQKICNANVRVVVSVEISSFGIAFVASDGSRMILRRGRINPASTATCCRRLLSSHSWNNA